MAKGWECPKCHATYAPWVSRCRRCFEAGESKGLSIREIADKYFPNRESDELTVSIGDPHVETYTSTSRFKVTIAQPRPTITLHPDGAFMVRGYAGEA
jgi:hypothetical protein